MCVSINKTPDGKMCLLNIRMYKKGRATKTGVTLFLDEAKWFRDTLSSKKDGSTGNYRKIDMVRTWDGIRISVEKPDVTTSIRIPDFELKLLLEKIDEILKIFEVEMNKINAVEDATEK